MSAYQKAFILLQQINSPLRLVLSDEALCPDINHSCTVDAVLRAQFCYVFTYDNIHNLYLYIFCSLK